ncbi:bacterial alpha-L-rhamnosidase-domain-containing protein [Mycena sp. CBHHK59/15]|nr:bacterial alpha-L-rhamnosidase-domain-containing protein [Mycena sp. CBHHK59/15]
MRPIPYSFGIAWAIRLVALSNAYPNAVATPFSFFRSDLRDTPLNPISISSLLVENKVAPIGIDVSPRFSWVITSSQRGWQRLILAPYLAEYAGPALQSDTRYFWTVDVATNIGSTSASSNFTTGLLSQDAWSPSLWIGKNTSVIPDALSTAFVAASWIWTSEPDPSNSPAGDRAFRLTYISPTGKNAKSAIIVMTVDDRFTLYVNGVEVGASPNVTDIWKSAQIIHVAVNSSSNLFAYGVSPWDNQVIIAVPTTITPSLTTSDWIWAVEPSPPNAPPGTSPSARLPESPSKTAVSAVIILTADNLFTLYVTACRPLYRVPLNASVNLFAVRATNLGTDENPAGLLVAISILYSDGSTDFIASDTTWKLSSTDDSSWVAATSLGAYGVAPWNTGVIVSDPLGEHPAPLLRKSFSITKEISYARLYYSAGGFASISVNGVPASDHALTPGFTKYDTQVQYVGLDVTSLLIQGENAIALELGRSYYGVTQQAESQWNWVDAAWHGEPAFRGVLSIGYTDGTTGRVVSDGSWKVIEGPTRLDDIYGGENYDASYVIPGYENPGFDDSAWDYVQVSNGPSGILVNARQPPTRLVESLRPISVTEPVPGIYVAAFERIVAGWAKITATGPAKTLITIHFGEKLNSDGTVIYLDVAHNFANNWQTDRFWLAGTGGAETFEPKFSYKGYQYVKLEGWPGPSPPTAEDIIGQVVHDDLQTRGDFASSSDLFNKLHAAVRYTMLNNVHSIPTDCPTFEKKGWSGDAMLGTEMFLSNFDSSELLAKYARDLHETRAQGQGPPDVIGPDTGFGWDTQAPTWHSALILTPAWIYEYRGDKRVLSDHYASMKNYMEFELGRSPGNIASTWLGDWNTPETSPEGGNPPEDSRVPATAFLYRMFTAMHDIALVLENSDDAASFAAQASAVKDSFNAAFFNATAGYYNGVGDSGYRQSHNILALAFNLTQDNETATAVAGSIVNDVVNRGMHLNTGALGTKYLLPMLTAYGHVDTAFALAEQTTFPSWGFWIENGATTTSFLGTFEDWFFKHVLGIQSTSVAFQTVDINPAATDRIASASGWMFTPFGNLSVAWTSDAGSLAINVGVPVGITATVSFSSSSSQLSESGVDLRDREGVTVLASSPGEPVRVAVGSGQYAFVAS